MIQCDVCIIGAGPAGLTAGIFAAEQGAKVIMCETNTVPGKKLLRTGGGRCNLTHCGSVDDFIKAYGQFGRFLQHSLYEFGPNDVREFFQQLNLATKVEATGCVFPVTDRATDVSRVLVDRARRLDIIFWYGKRVVEVEKRPKGFWVNTENKRIECRSIIIATGGVSWPFTGSTGDGFDLAVGFGHEIIEPKAALVRLVAEESWPSQLQGVGVEQAGLTATVNGKKIKTSGAVMFTDDGIGGPAVFDISRLLADDLASGTENIEMFIDLMPNIEDGELDSLLTEKCAASAAKELARVLTDEMLPRAIVLKLCYWIAPSTTILAGQLPKAKRKELVRLIKHLSVKITATRPIEEATITRGGINTEQIDRKTMESKLCKGMFFAGEIINVDGPCGGYNLQIAWSTGALAGKSAGK
jgi:predicted Rossmann fold flavoprotein